MTATIIHISKEEFTQIEPSRHLIVHEYAKRYGLVQVVGSDPKFAISWRSDLIEPSLCCSSGGITWVGIDERLAAVHTNERIVFSIGLSSPLLAITSSPNGVLAICELEAININEDCSINSIINFPDLVEDFSLSHNRFSVSFVNGGSSEFTI